MVLTDKLLFELQRRLKIGNRRGVHLNAIPGRSRYKFDLNRLSHIDENLPDNFINALLSEQPLKFRISWKDNVPDLNTLFEDDQAQLVRITKSFENLINQTEAIESEKGINTFGFGFPILIRRDQSDGKLTVAPILIWSLRIKRTKEFNTWEINRNEDDPIYLNEVLINHLQSDSKISIEQIPSEMLDDGLISKDELVEICVNLLKEINTSVPSELTDTFNTKINAVRSVSDKTHYEKLPISSSNALIEFGGLFSIFEVQKQNIIGDYENLMELQGMSINIDDMESHSFQPISSVETDPSQQGILHALETDRNILIQGPPGTGKSQTLSAILINALENQKKVLVVCEKRTALEVLHNSLIDKGLNYHCVLVRDIVKDRKNVVDSVRDRVDNSSYRRYRYTSSKESLDAILRRAKALIDVINGRHRKLDEKLLGSKNWTDLVGEFIAQEKQVDLSQELDISDLNLRFSTQEYDTLLNAISIGEPLYRQYSSQVKEPFLNSNKLKGDNPFQLEDAINNDFNLYSKSLSDIEDLYNQCKAEYFDLRQYQFNEQKGRLKKPSSGILSFETEIHRVIREAKESYKQNRLLELNGQIKAFTEPIARINSILADNEKAILDEAEILSFKFSIAALFSKRKKNLKKTIAELRYLFDTVIYEHLKSKDFEPLGFGDSLVEKRNSLVQFDSQISSVRAGFETKVVNEFDEMNLEQLLLTDSRESFISELKALISTRLFGNEVLETLELLVKRLESISLELENQLQLLKNELSNSKDLKLELGLSGSFSAIKIELSDCMDKVNQLEIEFQPKIESEFQSFNLLETTKIEGVNSLEKLQESIFNLADKIESDDWTRTKVQYHDYGSFLEQVTNLIERNHLYFDSQKDSFITEFKWFEFYNRLFENQQTILTRLGQNADWKRSFVFAYLKRILIKSASSELPMDDVQLVALDESIGGLEQEQLKYIREYWFSKQIDASREFEQRNVNLSVENLYNKRSSHRFKRLSLRQIVQYDADLFTTFFPIVLTSPDVASNLFKGMNGYFDVVMFDEASQLRLEDNLPAILKGKQIVIAGDEHQMPPSNYFSKVFDGTIEDEDEIEEEDEIVVDRDNMLLSCESLLDFATELNFEKRHLDFHYRSRHPYLIDFSNYAFYSQRLRPLPNNFDYTPIKYIHVDGTFSDHINDVEAELVLSILENNINRLPNGKYPTVGIATFNIAQRNHIKSKLLQRQKFSRYEEFNSKIQELEEDGMFIKNLENIQGDERDVIILSTTYGPGKDGKFAQRFGPINHSKGYKLLNVIITRAKYKVYVCSSIPEDYFLNYKEFLVAEGSNNKRAVFYAYLAYSKAVSERNHDLRLGVLTALSENSSRSATFNIDHLGELESPFEEEVYQRLVDQLDESKLTLQMKVSEFRIDIVYDSKIAGVPKVAIECDGAKYHSSREAYLHDRHRQKILEGHGFVFHRIWSTNWWRNPQRETQKLIEFIRGVEERNDHNLIDHSQISQAFNDEIEAVEVYVSQGLSLDVGSEVSVIKTIEQKEVIQPKLFQDGISLGSKVTIRYVNSGKDITVQIVEKVERNELVNGVQKISVGSPLAVALIGQSVGEIVKIGSLDNYVEIIKASK